MHGYVRGLPQAAKDLSMNVIEYSLLPEDCCFVYNPGALMIIRKGEESLREDILSCSELIPRVDLKRNRHNLVVHASRLPQGKGWSPMTWQILEGADHFPVTLFEAVAAVDAGPIYLQREMHFDGTELVDDLRRIMGEAIVALCLEFVERYPAVLAEARPQAGDESFYPRRRPEDSRLDIDKRSGSRSISCAL